VVEGIASVDESAITGESAPVIRESGGDRSAVTGGTKVLSDRIVVKITSKPGETFIDRMIALVEGAKRQKTPNEIALNILLASLTIIFMLAVATLQPMAYYSKAPQTLVILVALLVALIPTTIGALLSAIGIAGMDRLVQRNVLAMSGRAVEAAGDVNTLLLDKTGTITIGNRQATEFMPVGGVREQELADAAQLSSMADYTPEGRSIAVLAKERYGLRERHEGELRGAEFVEFTAQTRMSGIDLADGRKVRKGASSAVREWIRSSGGTPSDDLGPMVDGISAVGGTPLVVAEYHNGTAGALGVIHLKDMVKEGIAERFAEMRRMGIRTVMITGDNQLTAKAIANESGVDDFLAEATPEDKMALIRNEQEGGKLVAMTGDGTNDAPALAQSDVGVAMNTGTSAAKEAGNMVDLDSNPTKLIEIVEIGKQLLITRGSLTTFSIANDVAKYFAIIPAMFASVIPGLAKLNILHLHSPQLAIASAIIFNSLIIVALIPLALRGVRYRPSSAASMLRRNLWIYGIGGLIIPFIGIKAHRPHHLSHSRIWRLIVMSRFPSVVRQLLAGLRGLLVFTAICGILYPLVVYGVGQAAFNKQANGSLVHFHGRVVGSSLLCQEFTNAKGNPLPQYFQPRASASATSATNQTGGCNPLATGASNLGPNNTTLVQDIKAGRSKSQRSTMSRCRLSHRTR
jgi:potassium-transporting ATPase ATP-binding subunit